VAVESKVMRVTFICTANVCRSVMAHAILEAHAERLGRDVDVFSAGVRDFTGTPPAEAAWITCLQRGTPMGDYEATYAVNLDLASMSWILAMEQGHVDWLQGRGLPSTVSIALLGRFDPEGQGDEIADPINQGIPAFERCYTQIERCVKGFIEATGDVGIGEHSPG
jgi:protein-tyrosine phosphatase